MESDDKQAECANHSQKNRCPHLCASHHVLIIDANHHDQRETINYSISIVPSLAVQRADSCISSAGRLAQFGVKPSSIGKCLPWLGTESAMSHAKDVVFESDDRNNASVANVERFVYVCEIIVVQGKDNYPVELPGVSLQAPAELDTPFMRDAAN